MEPRQQQALDSIDAMFEAGRSAGLDQAISGERMQLLLNVLRVTFADGRSAVLRRKDVPDSHATAALCVYDLLRFIESGGRVVFIDPKEEPNAKT